VTLPLRPEGGGAKKKEEQANHTSQGGSTMMRALHTNKGFTLIELMIVVAIIGILAAIAIPNFLKFQAKSRQAEAKTNLGGMFTAEESYRAEFSGYSTDMIAIGWGPSGSPRYLYGFTTAFPAGVFQDTLDSGVCAAGGACVTTYMLSGAGAALVNGDLPATTADNTYYTAGAVGNVDNDTTNDQWTMTATRVLFNFNNDVSN
jgi:type IV pilus assembly protein PilA